MRLPLTVLILVGALGIVGNTVAAGDAQPTGSPTKAGSRPATRPQPKQDPLRAALAAPILGKGDVVAAFSRYGMDHLPAQPKPRDLADWQKQSDEIRQRALDQIVFRGRAAAWKDAPLRVEWRGAMAGGPGYTIRKLRYEAVPGLWIPALVYMPDRISGKRPAVLNFHGHAHGPGKAYAPKQIRCINMAKRGMIAMSPEWLWTGQLRQADYSHGRASQLDLCGASGLAPFYLSMSRAMDVLMAMDHVDPKRVAVTGLSGGGWQTILFGALDRRAALVAPDAGYASLAMRIEHRESLGDYEQAPVDLAEFCDYTHLTAMVAPRPLVMLWNAQDNCCFVAGYTLSPLVAAALPVYRLYDKPWRCQWHVNYEPGTHNYERDNREAFYHAVNNFLLTGDQRIDATEIPSDAEVKTREQLAVKLPKDNATFQTLAMRLMRDLPKDATPPADVQGRAAWIREHRAALRRVIRLQEMPCQAETAGDATDLVVTAPRPGATTDTTAGTPARVQRWRLTLGPYWTVPAVEITPRGKAVETVMLMADGGRASQAARVAELIRANRRVLLVDPLLVGEQRPEHRYDADRLALLVQTTGGRIAGLSTGQVIAVARWAKKKYETRVHLESHGPRTSFVGLTATAVEPGLVDGLKTHDSLDSLKEVIRRNWDFGQMPEAFCFGLLEVIDIPQLRVMVEER